MSSSAAASYHPDARSETNDRDSSDALSATPPEDAGPPLFSPDTMPGEDRLGRAATAGLLAELCCHREAGTPILIGLLGRAGAGKSSLLRLVLDRIQALTSAERADPFLPGVVSVRVDASAGTDPAATLLSRLFGALSTSFPGLAEEAVYAGGDPLKAAHAAGERVNDLRRQLDAERQTLDELGGRRARLAETVLFNSPGSRIDTYARQNRPRIETRLRAFGLPVADPVASYKELVREAAETGSGSSRTGLALRALWGFKGQGTLLVLAVLLLLAGWGCMFLAGHQSLWVDWLSGFGDRMAGPTAWAVDRAGWLMPLAHAAFALAALAVLVDIIRAIRFLQPVFRGASLLGGDLEGRRRDLDSLLAHQTRRVDHLAGEVEAAVRGADVAERRVEARKAAGLLQPSLSVAGSDLGDTTTSHDMAASFLDGLRTAIDAQGSVEAIPVPSRIVVALDELDRLSPEAAAGWLDTAQRLLGGRHFVTLAAFDRAHVLSGFSETDPALAAARLRRCLQLSYDLDAETDVPDAPPPAPLQRGSVLDQPWRPFETHLMEALKGFAGVNPRARKSLVNRYRVARVDPRLIDATPAELAGLAVALALDGTGSAIDLGAYRDDADPRPDVASDDPGPRRALGAAQQAIGRSFTAADARRGLQVARLYAL